MEMIKVYIPNVKGRALVESLVTRKVYIIPAIGYYTGQEIQVNLENAEEVPSLFWGIGELYKPNVKEKTEEIISFIKEKW